MHKMKVRYNFKVKILLDIQSSKDATILNKINNKEQKSDQNNVNELDDQVYNSQNFQQTFRTTVIEVEANITQKSEIKVHLKNISLEIKKGELVAIIGEVGSCKSTLLNAFLNNLIPLNNNKKGNITINGEISYITQCPWIRNETLRNNILFLREYNEIKYNKIIDVCQLKQDIDVLSNGDSTEIGEKGINLSGGQKARVALARAMYSDSDIYLFDDPLSALDAHVGDSIFRECILKELKSKTRVLVTNAYQFLSYMDKVIYMKDGEIKYIGSYDELVKKGFIDKANQAEEKSVRKRTKSIEEIEEEILPRLNEEIKYILL